MANGAADFDELRENCLMSAMASVFDSLFCFNSATICSMKSMNALFFGSGCSWILLCYFFSYRGGSSFGTLDVQAITQTQETGVFVIAPFQRVDDNMPLRICWT